MSTTYCVSENQSSTTFGLGESGRLKSQPSTQRTLRESFQKAYCRFMKNLATRRQQKIDRQAFETMLGLDDELLNDIGVTRDAVRWAAQLPLNEDAAVALRKDMSVSVSRAGSNETLTACNFR